MLQTYEANLYPNGVLQFAGFDQPAYDKVQRVLVTMIEEKRRNEKEKAQVKQAKALAKKASKPVKSVPLKLSSAQQKIADSLSPWFGMLKDSPNFKGDPMEIQRQMRSEWR